MTVRRDVPSRCKFATKRRVPCNVREERRRAAGIREAVETAANTSVTVTDVGAAGADLVLGRYRIGRRLGAGGMGVVHLAHDEHLDRAVAVKRIEAANPAVARRAQREARAAARLAHPGIVALHEAGRDGDTVVLVSELVRGHTLSELLEEGALSDRDVVELAVALCDALAHAHGRGVVHRDVKPQNILVPARPDDAGGVAKLTDFGVAHVLGDDALTATGDIVGTLAYMAPEQASGGEVTVAADLYALALVVYEALAGVNPVRRGGAAETAKRIGTRLPALGRMRRDLPPGLCAAVDRAVRPDPRDRGDLADLRAALAEALEEVDDAPGTVAAPATETLRHVGTRVESDEPLRVPARIVAGTGAGLLVAAVAAWLGPALPLPLAAAGGVAAVLVALLPRLGWLLASGALVVTFAGDDAGGTAVVVGAAALAPVLLVRRDPQWWPAPALAPVLGAAALAVAFPAVAGQAPRPLQRLALGLVAAWWLLLAEAWTGDRLLDGAPAGTPTGEEMGADAGAALGDVLVPLATGGGLLVGVVWGVAALVLPYLVRGRAVAADVVGATAWAAGLATATQLAGATETGLVVPGAVLAAVVAVLVAASRGPRDTRIGDG